MNEHKPREANEHSTWYTEDFEKSFDEPTDSLAVAAYAVLGAALVGCIALIFYFSL